MHITCIPIGGINTGIDVTMKTAVLPFYGCTHASVFDGIVMDVFDVSGKVDLIADYVFPEPVLPYGLSVFVSPGLIRWYV